MNRFQGAGAISNILDMVFVIVFALVLNGCDTDKKSSIPERQKDSPYCCDYTGLLGSDREGLSIFFEEFLKESNIEFVVAVMPSLGEEDINALTAEFFRKWQIGHKNQGRGVLLFIAIAEKMIRFEVSYEMEHMFTDGLCGYIATLQLKPYLRQGFIGMALQDVAFFLVERIRISKDQQAEKIYRTFEDRGFKTALRYGSGGAGVERKVELGTGWEEKQTLNDNQKSIFPAGTTPYATLMGYKTALTDLVTEPHLDIYTEATQIFYEYWPINCLDSVRDLQSLTEGDPLHVEIRGRFAVAKPNKNFKHGHPFFLVKGNDNLWRIDNARLWHNCGFSKEGAYVVFGKRHPYNFAYGAEESDIRAEQQKAWREEQIDLRSQIMSLKQKIAETPDNYRNYLKLGDLYFDKCHCVFYAYELYDEALKLKPNDPYLCEHVAWRLAASTSKKKRALELFEKSYSLNPNSLFTVKELAWLYSYFKKPAKARKYFKKASALERDIRQ